MSAEPLALAASLDVTAAGPLVQDLLARRGQPLTLDASTPPSSCESRISTVPEIDLADPTRDAPLMRTLPLTLLAVTSPLMSVTLMLPEIDSAAIRVPAGGWVGWAPGEAKVVRLVRFAGSAGGRP